MNKNKWRLARASFWFEFLYFNKIDLSDNINGMKRIIVIGTLHAGLTPNLELEQVLEKYKPNQLLVEIDQEDIDAGNISLYPPEMIFAYSWAISKSIKVYGFDCKMNIFSEEKNQTDNQVVIMDQKRVMGKLTWKDMNKKDNLKILNVPLEDGLIDQNKEKEREIKMLENIRSLNLNGTVVVLTGCKHLKLFEENLNEAIFPFR